MSVPTFSLYQFNPRRWVRGAPAARVAVANPDGTNDLLWMTEQDIRKNIKAFGESLGLDMALNCYKRPGQEYPVNDEFLTEQGRAIHRAAEEALRTGTSVLLIDPNAVADRLVSDYLKVT